MIKAVVEYNKEVNEDLLKFNALSNPWKWLVYLGATAISIMLVIMNRNSDFFAISIAILISAVIMDLVVLYYYFIAPKQKLNNLKDADIVKNTIEFSDQYIQISTTFKGKKSVDKLYYQQLYRIYEGKNAFYLFVDKYNTLIVTKKGIVVGTIDGLKKLLNDKVKNKKRNKLK